jgi:peroxiredoxin
VTLKAFAERRAITFTLLSDPMSAVIDSYGLRDPAYQAGSRAYGVPRPAILVIGRDGVIKALLAEDVINKRPPLTALLEALDQAK